MGEKLNPIVRFYFENYSKYEQIRADLEDQDVPSRSNIITKA